MYTNSLWAGAAQIDITPPLGTIINGDFTTHYAHTIHDPLYAKTLILQNSHCKLAIVVVDICVMPQDFLDGVKARINKELGIFPKNILISSTHTHAAGSIAEVHLVGADLGYRNKLPSRIVEAVRLALKKLRPAQLAFGSANAPEHVVCRRYLMKEAYTPINPLTGRTDAVKTNPVGVEKFIEGRASGTDPEVGFLAVKGMDGGWISMLANYSLHYVGDWENGTISADYFGVFAREMQQGLQACDEFVCMMSNGTSGDANIWDFLEPGRYPSGCFEKSQLIGSQIAKKVRMALTDLAWQSNPSLSAHYQTVPVKLNKPTSEELEKARHTVASSDYDCLVADEAGLRKIYAREQLLLNEFPDTINCPVQVLQIGSGSIGGLPGEFFAETGLWLKEHAQRSHYFTVSLANGNVGYVPPAREASRGGYETWRCRISCLETDAEIKIRENLLGLINDSALNA